MLKAISYAFATNIVKAEDKQDLLGASYSLWRDISFPSIMDSSVQRENLRSLRLILDERESFMTVAQDKRVLPSFAVFYKALSDSTVPERLISEAKDTGMATLGKWPLYMKGVSLIRLE